MQIEMTPVSDDVRFVDIPAAKKEFDVATGLFIALMAVLGTLIATASYFNRPRTVTSTRKKPDVQKPPFPIKGCEPVHVHGHNRFTDRMPW
jgi:hypothetical protein